MPLQYFNMLKDCYPLGLLARIQKLGSYDVYIYYNSMIKKGKYAVLIGVTCLVCEATATHTNDGYKGCYIKFQSAARTTGYEFLGYP